MLYTPFGRTGLHVSRIGFGGMRFRPDDDPAVSAELAIAAYAEGINYFDTAPGYGNSEQVFGEAFKHMKKTRAERPFYVATKSGHADPDKIRKDLETSLERMGLEYVDFYFVWCVMHPDDFEHRKAQGALRAFETLKEEGLVRHICVSTHMTGTDTEAMLRAHPFEAVLLGYCAANFLYREHAVEAAAKAGLGLVAMNPLGGGVIPDHPDRFAFIRTRPGESVTHGALRFLLSDPRVSVALVGLGTHEHLKDTLSVLDGFEPLSEAEHAQVRAGIREGFDALCTGCRYCEPCPAGVPIPKLMDTYNLLALENNPKAARDRLRWHWGVPPEDERLNACTACGLCEERCTQHLPIVERIRELREAVRGVKD